MRVVEAEDGSMAVVDFGDFEQKLRLPVIFVVQAEDRSVGMVIGRGEKNGDYLEFGVRSQQEVIK